MVRAGSIRWMTYSTIKRFFQLSVDRFPFPAVAEMNDDNTFRSFGKVFEEAYPVVCLPITANDEGIDNGVYFNNLCNKLNELPYMI